MKDSGINVYLKFLSNKNARLIAALLVPCIILFSKTLGYGFTTLDEQWMIVKNAEFLSNWASLSTSFTKPITEFYYRPILMASFVIDFHIGGLSPIVYHFSNLVFHISSVILLFYFFLCFEVDKRISVFYCLLFSIHPLVLHAVAWIPGRNDLLLCIFALASLIFLKRYIANRNLVNLLFHFLFFCLTLFTKENAIVLPIVYFFIFLADKKRENGKIVYIGMLWTGLTVLFLFFRANVIIKTLPTLTNYNYGGIMEFMYAFVVFTGKSILPFYQSILPVNKSPSIVLGIFLIAIIVLFIVRLGINNKHTAMTGVLLFTLLLVIPVWFGAFKSAGEHYEHRSYTSLSGFFLLMTQIKFNFNEKVVRNSFILLFCVFFIKTYSRLRIYRDPETFVDAGLKERPDYYLFYFQKGEAFYKKREFSLAKSFITKAISIRPDKAELYNFRGSAEYALKMYPEAISDFTEAIKRGDFKMEYYLNRCIALKRSGDLSRAAKDYLIIKTCCDKKLSESLKKSLDPLLNR